jgi:hypothetical protein
VLKDAQANAHLIKFEDLDSNHPIVQKMVEDVVAAYDTARAALFPKDNKLYDTAMYMVNAALNYAKDSGRFDIFSHTFKQVQDMRETYYSNKYKAKEPVAPKKVPQQLSFKDVKPVASAPSSDISALKQQVLDYGKLPNRSIPANRVLKTIEGKGNPGDVVVSYQKEGATHFRPTPPNKLRPGETVVWDGKQSLPKATPGIDYLPFDSELVAAQAKKIGDDFKAGKITQQQFDTQAWELAQKYDGSIAKADYNTGEVRIVPRGTVITKAPVNIFDRGYGGNAMNGQKRYSNELGFESDSLNDVYRNLTENGYKPGARKGDGSAGDDFWQGSRIERWYKAEQPKRISAPPPAPAKSVSELPKPNKLNGKPDLATPLDKGGNPRAHWKLHLAVDPKNYAAVDAVVKDLLDSGQIKDYKQGRNSGQEGKDFTIYIGPKEQAQLVADHLTNKVGHLLDNPKGEALIDDTSFGGKVMGRFDANDKDMAQYGSQGIPYTKDDMGQKTWGSVTSEQARANADKILRERYGEFYTGTSKSTSNLPQPKATTRLATPEEKAAIANKPAPSVPGDYADLYNQINNPPNVRFKADQTRGGKVSGMVLTPEKMRQLSSKFNRTETLTSKGDVYNKGTDREQMNRWFQDFVATDEYYRKISNNTFKLDPETLGPVRIADGISLDELMGKPAPEKIGPTIPPLPDAAKDLNGRELLEQIKAKLGDDAEKNFDEMDPVQADIYRVQLAREIFGVDPLNPLTNPKGSAEHARGTELLQKYLDDMDSRKAKYESDTAKGAAKTEQYNLDMQKVTESLMAERFQAQLKAREGAYKKVKQSFFDYRDKNRIDQVLGTLLPFQYWARQNFAYLARHFAANPYHFAAILNYYKQQEKQNSDPTIPGYAKSNMHIADVSPGVHLMWDNSSMDPFTPFGSNQIMGGLVMMDDNEFEAATQGGKVANSQPFGIADIGKFIFGKDVVSKTQIDPKTGKPKVIARDKGLAGSWLNPNPMIKDSLLQTGLFNKAVSGALGPDQTTFGQDYPEETRAAHASASWFPAANLYAATAAATPIGPALRSAGITKGEFNPVQPLTK